MQSGEEKFKKRFTFEVIESNILHTLVFALFLHFSGKHTRRRRKVTNDVNVNMVVDFAITMAKKD